MGSSSNQPDYAGAIAAALHLLRTQLPATFTYHCAEHTELDVIPAVIRLAKLSGVTAQQSWQLQVAAAYHDVGYVQSTHDHEAVGIAFLFEKLPEFGFDSSEIETLAAMILATRMPQSPHNNLEALLADADLDSLGRDDFFVTSEALWREQVALGKHQSWHEWLCGQLVFLQGHHYFTAAARALRDTGKQRNIALLLQQLDR